MLGGIQQMTLIESKYKNLEIKDCSVTEYLFEGLSKNPDHISVIDGMTGDTFTAGQVMENIKRFAGGLVARNLGKGHTVALMAPNVPEYYTVFHGVAWAGGTITTMNPTYTASEVNHQLNDANVQLLIVHANFVDVAREAVKGTGVEQIATIGKVEGLPNLEDMFGDPLEQQVPVDLDDHVIVLPYSSGTTGLPKGVMLTHRNIVANLCQVNALAELDKSEEGTNVTPAFVPFFHIYGMLYFVNHYPASLCTVITLPRFDLEQFLQLAQDHRAVNLWVVPPVALALAKHPIVDNYDLSSVKVMFSGAAPLRSELSEAVEKRLDCTIVQGYGMTELSPVCHLVPSTAPKTGSVGLTVAGTTCRIVNIETGEDMDLGEEGEIWVKGPQVMKGYLNNPEATRQMIDEDGWLKTGDVGYFDKEEYLFIVDRVKELIKFKGFQVAPAELEATLTAHPQIIDAAVIGIPDDEAGELPIAYIKAEEGADLSLEGIQDYMRQHLASYKAVQAIKLVDEIPKSASGKILRRVLRDKYDTA
jgi:acyl-CoA synthetase (AMP-forming)/AMP-acid ligase II